MISEILSVLMSWCASYVTKGGNESSMRALGGGAAPGANDGAADMYVDYSNRYESSFIYLFAGLLLLHTICVTD
jgi:hypothetical protein